MIPHRIGSDALFGPRRELHDDVIEPEIGVDREDQLVDFQAFFGKLLLGAEDMCVILREAAHPHQSMQARLTAHSDAPRRIPQA